MDAWVSFAARKERLLDLAFSTEFDVHTQVSKKDTCPIRWFATFPRYACHVRDSIFFPLDIFKKSSFRSIKQIKYVMCVRNRIFFERLVLLSNLWATFLPRFTRNIASTRSFYEIARYVICFHSQTTIVTKVWKRSRFSNFLSSSMVFG